MKKRIYLAGPISGLSYLEATLGWRQAFTEALSLRAGDDIECMSPMRGKNYLQGRKRLGHGWQEMLGHKQACSAPAGIVARDRNDVMTCDAMVACFLGAERVSIGTCIEFGWADAYRKPIVAVFDQHHDHAMLRQMAGFVVDDLEAAAEIVTFLLLP